MKPLHVIGLFLAALVLASCANQPLQHSYEGDVDLRWLEVKFEPLQLHDKELSGNFTKVTKIQKIWQSLGGVFNEEQNRILYQQLSEFEQILV